MDAFVGVEWWLGSLLRHARASTEQNDVSGRRSSCFSPCFPSFTSTNALDSLVALQSCSQSVYRHPP